ncbi:MAG: hypothetical protein R3E32_00820 [Chitinophagales bacterium]
MKVGILFGGRSREREISFAGGRTVYDNLDKSLFTAVPIFVDSFGNFTLLDWQYVYKGSVRDFYPPAEFLPSSPNVFQIYAESLELTTKEQQIELLQKIGKPIATSELPKYIDFAFLTLHGAYGEDGSIQGLLQYLDIPYTASGILPSAIGMNKVFQKRMMQGGGFEGPVFWNVKKEKWLQLAANQEAAKSYFEEIKAKVGFPMVIKAANQGSSIGAMILTENNWQTFAENLNRAFFLEDMTHSRWTAMGKEAQIDFVRNLVDIRSGLGLPLQVNIAGEKTNPSTIFHPEKLLSFLQNHFNGSAATLRLAAYDTEKEVIIEEFLKGKEFSCIVLKDEKGELLALPPTEIRTGHNIYDYRSKYLPGMSRKVTPIELEDAAIEAIRSKCKRLFDFFQFHTYARIDGFYTEKGEIFLNDPNTTSGMLPSSFFFHQAAEIGLNPSQFLTYIIRSSLQERMEDIPNNFGFADLLPQLDAKIVSLQSQKKLKKRVGVVLGGYSTERHISVESGRNIYEKLASSEKYLPIPIFLTGNDEHYELYEIPINILLKDNADDIKDKIDHFKKHPIVEQIKEEAGDIIQKYTSGEVVNEPQAISVATLAEKVDIVFIALHGRPGEDGHLQSDLEKYNLPYNGSGVTSSNRTIDKYATNQLLKKHGVYVADQLLVRLDDWMKNQEETIDDIGQTFKYPLIAKPSDDGCSSAVKKIRTREELKAYLQLMFRAEENFDRLGAVGKVLHLQPNEEFPQKAHCLIEELIEQKDAVHFLEVTGGLLTHFEEGKIRYEMFEPSETLASEDILSLEEKFLAGHGQNITPARYDKNPTRRDEIAAKVKADLQKVAEILEVEGYARIDAFVKVLKNGEVQTYVIEVNSLPGMTPATAIFHQCALNGYTPYAFIDAILEYGFVKRSVEVLEC